MPQRSPVIFWLLLAATLSLIAVAFFWQISYGHAEIAGTVFEALAIGQLNVLCIWSALRPVKNLWTRVVPWAAAAIISAISGTNAPQGPTAISCISYYGLEVALVLAGLLLLERSSFWRRRSSRLAEWRFSIGQLFVVTTIVALLIVAMKHSEIFFEQELTSALENVLFVFGSALLAVASVILWNLRCHWMLRLAAVLALAIMLGAAWYLELGRWALQILVPHFLIEAVVISIWIASGQVTSVSRLTAAHEV